jgi:hypothetical protein
MPSSEPRVAILCIRATFPESFLPVLLGLVINALLQKKVGATIYVNHCKSILFVHLYVFSYGIFTSLKLIHTSISSSWVFNIRHFQQGTPLFGSTNAADSFSGISDKNIHSRGIYFSCRFVAALNK